MYIYIYINVAFIIYYPELNEDIFCLPPVVRLVYSDYRVYQALDLYLLCLAAR